MGFLCNFDLSEMERTVKQLVDAAVARQSFFPKYLESKMRLLCTFTNDAGQQAFYHCFNEIAVQKAEISHQVRVEVLLGQKLLTGYSGDGLLVATPTGSTAYALSSGGPIVNNEIRSLLMVPISPSSLSFRPIIMPPTTRITIKVAVD